MKTYLLITTCLILAGCSRQEASHREAKSELTGEPLRWALVNKSTISTAIYQWSRDKMEEDKKAQGLAPEIEEKISQYEVLESELEKKQMEMRLRGSFLAQTPGSSAPETDNDYEALTQKVAEAKAPIADIVDRRSRQAMHITTNTQPKNWLPNMLRIVLI